MAGLMDLFGGNFRDPYGREDPALGFGDALAQRSNTLIGLGAGLMRGRVGDAWEDAARGAQADASIYGRQQQLAQHAADQKRAQSNWERQFARSGTTEAQKAADDLGLKRGSPEHVEFMKQFYKMGDTGQITKIVNPQTGEEESVIYNPRLPADQQFRPIPQGAFGTQAPAAPDPWAGVGRGGGFAPATPAPVVPDGTPIAGPTAQLPPSFGPGRMGATPAPAGPGYLPPRQGPKAFEPEQKLRKEFEDTAKPYIVARQAYTKMNASQDNAAGDIALIFGYMKMLDPPSTVREGEFATAQNAGSVEDRIRNTYNRLLSGERLTPQQREQFKSQGEAVWKTFESEYQPRIEQFRNIAKQYRIDPSRVIPDLGPFPTRAPVPPKDGAGGGKKPAVQKWTTDANGNPIPVP